MASDFAPCVLSHPTPKSKNDEDHRNDSDGIHESVIPLCGLTLESYKKCFGYEIPETCLGTSKDVRTRILGQGKVLRNR